jgi:hypothetical protein
LYRVTTVGFVENATALGESGAGDLILKVIKMHMDKQDLVLAGLKAMNAICFHNRENSLRCISHRAYELIIAGLLLSQNLPAYTLYLLNVFSVCLAFDDCLQY